MKNLFKIPLVLTLATALTIWMWGPNLPVLSQEIDEFRENYVLKVRSIPVGQLRIAGRSNDRSYAATSVVFLTGLASIVSDLRVWAGSRGWLRNSRLVPFRYHYEIVRGGKQSSQVLNYASGRPSKLEISPPIEKELDVKAAKFSRTIDPVTMLFISFKPTESVSICGKDYKIFDGRRYLTISLTELSNNSNEVECNGRYELGEGFSERERERGKDDFKVTFRKSIRGDGLFRLQKIEAKTAIGNVRVERSVGDS